MTEIKLLSGLEMQDKARHYFQEMHRLHPQGRALGIDFGLKRVGLARSDTNFVLASKLTTILYQKDFITNLTKIVAENNIVGVLWGYPQYLKAQKAHPLQAIISDYAEALHQATAVAYYFVDERYSSQAVERILSHYYGYNAKQQKEKVDGMAATHILQSALDFLGFTYNTNNT